MTEYEVRDVTRRAGFLAATAVGAVVLVLTAPNFTIWSTLIGVTTLLNLYGFDKHSTSSLGRYVYLNAFELGCGMAYALQLLQRLAPGLIIPSSLVHAGVRRGSARTGSAGGGGRDAA